MRRRTVVSTTNMRALINEGSVIAFGSGRRETWGEVCDRQSSREVPVMSENQQTPQMVLSSFGRMVPAYDPAFEPPCEAHAHGRVYRCRSGRHVWFHREDAQKCCNGHEHILHVGEVPPEATHQLTENLGAGVVVPMRRTWQLIG